MKSIATSRKWSHFSFASPAVGFPQGFGSVKIHQGFARRLLMELMGNCPKKGFLYPKQPMYGIFTYIYHKNQPTVGKYPLHGWYGYWWILGCCCVVVSKMFISTPIRIFTFELSFSDGVILYRKLLSSWKIDENCHLTSLVYHSMAFPSKRVSSSEVTLKPSKSSQFLYRLYRCWLVL